MAFLKLGLLFFTIFAVTILTSYGKTLEDEKAKLFKREVDWFEAYKKQPGKKERMDDYSTDMFDAYKKMGKKERLDDSLTPYSITDETSAVYKRDTDWFDAYKKKRYQRERMDDYSADMFDAYKKMGKKERLDDSLTDYSTADETSAVYKRDADWFDAYKNRHSYRERMDDYSADMFDAYKKIGKKERLDDSLTAYNV